MNKEEIIELLEEHNKEAREFLEDYLEKDEEASDISLLQRSMMTAWLVQTRCFK